MLGACSVNGKDTRSVVVDVKLNADNSCTTRIKDTIVSVDDEDSLKKALAPYAGNVSNVMIKSETDLPYRCIGGLIYAMQRRGYKKVGFISEPPETRR